MLAHDGRQAGDLVVHDGGVVEPPSAPGLQDLHLHPLLLEIKLGHRQQQPGWPQEFARRQSGIEAVDLRGEPGDQLLEFLVGDRPAVHPDALAEIDQVGAGDQAGFPPGGFQQSARQQGGGSFALAARDGQGGQAVGGQADAPEEAPHHVRVPGLGIVAVQMGEGAHIGFVDVVDRLAKVDHWRWSSG